jgi:hypothetical protein
MRWASPPESVRGQPVEGQVAEAHALQEAQPVQHLVAHLARRRRRRLAQAQRAHLLQRLLHRQPADLSQVESLHAHGERLLAQAAATAGAAQRVAHEPAREEAVVPLLHLAPHRLQEGNHAGIGFVLPFQHQALVGARELVERDVGRDLAARAEAQQRREIAREALGAPGLDGALPQRQRRVGHDAVLVELQLVAEALAGGTGALGGIEREQPRRRVGIDAAATAAAQVAGKLGAPGQVAITHGHEPGLGQRQFHGLDEPRARRRLQVQAVDDHVDPVGRGHRGQRRGVGGVERVDGAPGHHALESLRQQRLPPAHGGAGAGRQRVADKDRIALGALLANLAPDRVGCVAIDVHIAGGAVHGTGPGPQHAQVVVDLGDGTDGGTPARDGVALLDGDGRADAVDPVDIGLGQALEELAGVGRERLHIAALAFGIERVEDERRLARARQAGDHREAAARDVDVDVPQVVLAGALDADPLDGVGTAGFGDGVRVDVGHVVASHVVGHVVDPIVDHPPPVTLGREVPDPCAARDRSG